MKYVAKIKFHNLAPADFEWKFYYLIAHMEKLYYLVSNKEIYYGHS